MRSGRVILLFAAVGCAGGPEGGKVTETFPGPYTQVSVATDTGRVEIVAGTGDAVTVEFLPSGSDSWDAVEDQGLLTIVASCLGATEVGCNGGFVVTVPENQEVVASTGAGQLAFTGALGGVLDGQTASGAIEAGGLGPADLTLLTGTGAVDVTFLEAPAAVSVDTGSSAVALGVPAGGYALDVDTQGTATVDPAITDDAGGPVLRVHSGNGNIGIVPTE